MGHGGDGGAGRRCSPRRRGVWPPWRQCFVPPRHGRCSPGRRAGRHRPATGGHHAVAAAAMVYMAARDGTGPATGAHAAHTGGAGRAGGEVPLLTGVLLIYFAAYVLRSGGGWCRSRHSGRRYPLLPAARRGRSWPGASAAGPGIRMPPVAAARAGRSVQTRHGHRDVRHAADTLTGGARFQRGLVPGPAARARTVPRSTRGVRHFDGRTIPGRRRPLIG